MRNCFEKVPGKYDLLKMDYADNESQDVVDKPKIKEEPPVKVCTICLMLIILILFLKQKNCIQFQYKY